MNDVPSPTTDPTPASPEPHTDPYEPFFMRWRRNFGPWVKQALAPERARARRWWWNRLFVQVPAPTEFREPPERLRELLAAHQDRSAEALVEAKELFARPFDTTDGVERRATTLQGAVAIAASFVLAGGGLLLDPTKIRSDAWRVAFAVLYAVVITSLVFSALRALRATSRVLVWHYPDDEDILRRGDRQQAAADYELALAADLLYAAGRNTSNARYKVAQMRAAGHWFALALAGLLATAVLLVAYLVIGPGSSAPSAASTHPAHAVRLPGRCLCESHPSARTHQRGKRSP